MEDDDIYIPNPIVYLQDENIFGILVSQGAYYSKVTYVKNGISYDAVVSNDRIIEGDL